VRGVGVQAQAHLLVNERVLLLDAGALGAGGALCGADHGLDFGRVDQAADVGLLDDVGGEEEVLLQGGGVGGAAVDVVERGEGRGRPDDEAAEVSAGRELEEVQGEDGGGLDAGQVAEGAGDLLAVDFGVVDDQGTAALSVSAATELTLSCAELAGVLHLVDIWGRTDGRQEAESGGGFGDAGTLEHLGVHDEWDFGNGGDLVTAGEEESRDGRSSQGRDGCESPEIWLGLLQAGLRLRLTSDQG
jgi:hypothetical protein